MPGVLQRGPVERPRAPQRHRRRAGDEQPLPAGEPQRRDQGQHQRQVGQRDEEDQRHDQPAAQVGGVPAGRVVQFARGVLLARSLRPDSASGRSSAVAVERAVYPARSTAAISSATGSRGGRGDPGGRGGVVHRRADLVQLVQLLLDPHRARRAGHPLDGQADLPGRGDAFSAGSGLDGRAAASPLPARPSCDCRRRCPGRAGVPRLRGRSDRPRRPLARAVTPGPAPRPPRRLASRRPGRRHGVPA